MSLIVFNEKKKSDVCRLHDNTNSNNDKINELNNKNNIVHIALIGFCELINGPIVYLP